MRQSARRSSARWLTYLCPLCLAGCVTATGPLPAGPPSSAVPVRPVVSPQKPVAAGSLPASPSAAAAALGPTTAVASPGAQVGAQGAVPPAGPPPAAMPKPPRPLLTGSLTTEYLYDALLTPSPTETLQNRLSEYLAFRWKNQAGPDLRLYFYGMDSHDFSTSSNDQYRIYKLYAEWNDIGSVLNLRVGRQPASGNTLFSRFDGLTLVYRPSPMFSVSVGGGFPANVTFSSDRVGMQSERRFYEIYATVYDWYHFGGKLYYGDASRIDLLRAAHAEAARIFVIAVDDMEASIKIAETVKTHFPNLQIIARVRNRHHAHRMMDLGIKTFVREVYLSSLKLAEEVLCGLGMPREEAINSVEKFRTYDDAALLKQRDARKNLIDIC